MSLIKNVIENFNVDKILSIFKIIHYLRLIVLVLKDQQYTFKGKGKKSKHSIYLKDIMYI